MRNRNLLGLIVLFLIQPQALACVKNPFLYEAKTERGSIVLFGSFHIGVNLKQLDFFTPGFVQQFDAVTVESSYREQVNFFDLKYNRKEMTRTNRPSLLTLLERSEVLSLRSSIERAWNLPSVNKEYIYYLHPLTALFILRQEWMVLARQVEIMDTQIAKTFEHIGKPVHHLEEFNLIYPDLSEPWRDYLTELKQTIANRDLLVSYLPMYCVGDAEGYTHRLNQYRAKFPDAYHEMLTIRNQAWSPSLLNLTKSPGRNLIVVGAGHLFNTDGLLAMFKQHGILFNRMKPIQDIGASRSN